MPLRIGIVGLPNVGKSTLFNALTRTKGANAENYPFCTIDPNIGIVEVPDDRIEKIAGLVSPAKVVPATVEFVDIAGLVKGAHAGEGLGNQFLHYIREVDAICHVIRAFENNDIIHVDGSIDPKRDRETVETELELADLGMKERHQKEKKPPEHLPLFLKNKPTIYALNVSEEELKSMTEQKARKRLHISEKNRVIVISAKIEEDLQSLSPEEAKDFLREYSVESSGLDRLIRAAYDVLGYITFFTAGPKEVHAWNIVQGKTAPEAAGTIHTDFQKGFICAETISYDDFITNGGELGAKEKGKMRTEGKDYVVQDGDVIYFRFNV